MVQVSAIVAFFISLIRLGRSLPSRDWKTAEKSCRNLDPQTKKVAAVLALQAEETA
jgi:hypothetical protein